MKEHSQPTPVMDNNTYKYYQSKHYTFRIVNGHVFELLTDGQWEYCPGLMSFYFDAASDYWEIEEPQI